MRLIAFGGTGYGSSYAPHNVEQSSPIASSALRYSNWISTSIRDAYKTEVDKSPKIQIEWNRRVLHNGAPLLNFHSRQEFNVVEKESHVSDEHLKQIVESTHKHFQKSFLTIIKEFSMFESVSDLSDEEVASFVRHLSNVLRHLQA